MANQYDAGLEKTPANYQPLTPLVFLERAAQVHPVHAAIIHGSEHTSYASFTRALASSPPRSSPEASATEIPSR